MPPQAWSFGDEPELAEKLLDAVLAGDKSATSSALWDYDEEGAPLPVVGELSILLDGENHPRALIRTTSVETTAFEEVDEDFAAAEGEGDRTLESWRKGHEAYFRRNLPRAGSSRWTCRSCASGSSCSTRGPEPWDRMDRVRRPT